MRVLRNCIIALAICMAVLGITVVPTHYIALHYGWDKQWYPYLAADSGEEGSQQKTEYDRAMSSAGLVAVATLFVIVCLVGYRWEKRPQLN